MALNYYSDIHAQRSMDFGNAICQRWPLRHNHDAAMLGDQTGVITPLEFRDIGVVVEVDWVAVSSTIDDADMRGEAFVRWVVNKR